MELIKFIQKIYLGFTFSLLGGFIGPMIPAVSNQFLGGYYADEQITSLTPSVQNYLNLLIMNLAACYCEFAETLFTSIKAINVNAHQLHEFHYESKKCLAIKLDNNQMKLEYVGD